MSGPTNAVIGDADFGTSLPTTDVPEEVLEEEKKLAKYSQTAEFKRLKEFMENRIKFYQHYFPDGKPIDSVPADPQTIASHWMAANIVVREFNNILNEYAQAK